MPSRSFTLSLTAFSLLVPIAFFPQQPPPPSAARILLLPKRIVAGETATLAVLDVNGRLTPGVAVNFSNGDHLVTNATGRALFAAPLQPGVIYATLGEHSARVYTTILTAAEVPPSPLRISSAPQFASLTDRFELEGNGLCGQADANIVRVSGRPALVLASSAATIVALPPSDLDPGPASVEISCANRAAPPFSIAFLSLALDADSSPLLPGEHRVLTVHITGSPAKVPLEARNLAPDIADLAGGKAARTLSSGGPQNTATFDLTGRQRGNFIISIRLLPAPSAPNRYPVSPGNARPARPSTR